MITSQQNDANLSEKRVKKYESQVTQLYNQISQLEQQLESATDENTKAQINNQID
jgi:regulator of replication initiation timing